MDTVDGGVRPNNDEGNSSFLSSVSSESIRPSPLSLSASSVLSSNKAFRRINDQVEKGHFYEAFQLLQTLYHRYLFKKKNDDACELYFEFAHKFAEKGEFDLSVEIAIFFIQMVIEMKSCVTEKKVQQILDIFKKYPKFKGTHKYRFMNKALGWVKNDDGSSEFLRDLHFCIANAYIEENSYGLAQGHLVFCNDGKRLAEMVEEWEKIGYPSERNLFALRSVLILLFLDDITTAENFVNNLHVDLDSADAHPCIQFAYLLTMACKFKNKQFYETLKKKYNLMIRRDASFDTYLTEIEKKYFGVLKKNDFNLLNLFGGLARGMGGGGGDGGIFGGNLSKSTNASS